MIEHFPLGGLAAVGSLADLFAQNSYLKAASNAHRALQAGQGISEYFLSKKIAWFCQSVGSANSDTAAKWLKKQSDDPERCECVVEQLILYIDKADEFNKAQMIAVLFIAWINDKITETELDCLIHSINLCRANDLTKLIKSEGAPMHSQESFMARLQGANLTRTGSQTYEDTTEGAFLDTSKLGKLLRKGYQEGKAQMDGDE